MEGSPTRHHDPSTWGLGYRSNFTLKALAEAFDGNLNGDLAAHTRVTFPPNPFI
jgi:hypothetical protein